MLVKMATHFAIFLSKLRQNLAVYFLDSPCTVPRTVRPPVRRRADACYELMRRVYRRAVCRDYSGDSGECW